MTTPECSKFSATTLWFSAVTNNKVGNPKQQRSQEVDPPAPIAQSASNINSAILLALIITLIFLSLA